MRSCIFLLSVPKMSTEDINSFDVTTAIEELRERVVELQDVAAKIEAHLAAMEAMLVEITAN